MEPTPVKPWYKKPIYLAPLAFLVFILGANALGGNSTVNSPQVTQTANALEATQAATGVTSAPTPTQLQEATTTPVNTTASKQTQPQTQTSSGLSNDNYYTNVSGSEVHSPAYSNNNSIPAGASAQCRDGTYSFSQHRSGTCSRHGGVAIWF